jgi:hypothetical protein
MVESTAQIIKKSSKSIPFLMDIHDSNHVKPLLERLISEEALWKETLGKDWKLKWVSCNIEDSELV